MAGRWGEEPKLEELLRDCTLQLLMRRDGVDEAAIWALAARAMRLPQTDAGVEMAGAGPSSKHERPAGNSKEMPCFF
jgi:hypothetical protein